VILVFGMGIYIHLIHIYRSDFDFLHLFTPVLYSSQNLLELLSAESRQREKLHSSLPSL